MRKQMMAVMGALLIAIVPLQVTAQSSEFDDETREIVVTMAQRVGQSIAPGASSSAEPEEQDQADVEETPAPQSEEPEAESDGAEVTLPELSLTDLAEYTSQGVTIQAPADWTVYTDAGEDVPFEIEVPGTDLVVMMTADNALDFPSWLGLALFRSQADMLVGDLGEDGAIEETSTLYTEQNLPVVKLAFSMTENDVPSGGSLYVTAPNSTAYVILASGPSEEWEYAQPGLELIARSIRFDDDLVEAVNATDGPLDFTNTDGTIQATVPQGWYAMATGDDQFPIIVAEPEVRYIVAIGTDQTFGDDFDPAIFEEFLSESGELDETQKTQLLDEVAALMEDGDSPIDIDTEQSEVVSRQGGVTVRLVGETAIDEDVSIPVIIFVDLRPDGAAIVAVSGDTESAMGVEQELQMLVESVSGL